MGEEQFTNDEEFHDLKIILDKVEKQRIPIENKWTYICSCVLFLIAFMIENNKYAEKKLKRILFMAIKSSLLIKLTWKVLKSSI